MGINPDGTHSFYDLDDTWYEYLKSDKAQRKQMCEDALAAEGIVFSVGLVGVIVFLITALCKGWI